MRAVRVSLDGQNFGETTQVPPEPKNKIVLPPEVEPPSAGDVDLRADLQCLGK
jgi:hypothetical protein